MGEEGWTGDDEWALGLGIGGGIMGSGGGLMRRLVGGRGFWLSACILLGCVLRGGLVFF